MEEKEIRLTAQQFYTNILNNCLNNLFDNGDRLKVTQAFVDGEKAWLDFSVVSNKGGGSRAVIYSVECQLSVIMDALQDAIERERHPKELNINDFVVETEDDSNPIELKKNLD